MTIRQLLRLLSPPAPALALCLVLLLAASVITLLNPWIAGQLTGQILGTDNVIFASFELLILTWIGLLVLRSALGFATSYVTGTAAEEVLAGLRSRLYEHLQLLPVSYYDDQKRGNVLSILTTDSAIVSNFVTGTLVQILPMAITFFGAAGMMAWLNLKIALVILAILPLYVLAMKIIGRTLRPLSRQWVDSHGELVSHAEENLGLLPVIKSYTREARELESFDIKNSQLLALSKRQLLIYTLLPPATTLLAGAGLLLLVWLGYRDIEAGVMNAPELVSLVFFAMLLNQPLGQLANVYGELQKTRGASERILHFFHQQREPASDFGIPLVVSRGAISFDRVSFAYPVGGSPVLDGLSLQVGGGETLAIVGENGAGKSTLVHLLMRLITPDSGTICIDDTDIGTVSLASLRSRIGLVAQHTLLLNGTVADNIGWGKAFASREAIEGAARAARAHDFIARLPMGYDTVIGDQGLKLSGGQRQRLSLARALLKDPPILVLDEATSMFDPAGEAELLRDCREIFAQRTVILITHRPASLAIADRVLRLQGGRLEEVQDVLGYLRTGEIS